MKFQMRRGGLRVDGGGGGTCSFIDVSAAVTLPLQVLVAPAWGAKFW